MSMSESIAERAYQLWDARGRPEGSHEEDWLEAERQLAPKSSAGNTVDASSEESFPASDPPASHGADNVPSNAGDKWAASNAAKANPSVDESDDAPAAAPGDIGEG